MKMPTRSPASRWFPRRVLRAALVVLFAFAGMGVQVAAASSADARTVYQGGGWFCDSINSYPYWSCYGP
jgi:hypothetical protein